MRLQCLCTLVLVSVLVLTTTVLAQTTLEKVNARGKLVCGVNTGLAGFAVRGSDGVWSGFDVDYCRALAAAIFNDASGLDHGVGHPASFSLSHCSSRWTEGCRRNID